MSQRFITTFASSDRGWHGDRPGYHHFQVFLDRSNKTEPRSSTRYLVEVVHQPQQKRYCFVRIIASVAEFWKQMEPILLQATWQRGQHLGSEPWTTIKDQTWGEIKVEFTNSKSRCGTHQYAYVTLCSNDFGQRCSFEVRKDEVDLSAIAGHVRCQCGPSANIGAVISRQSEMRRAMR